jgi:hypothetical protein
VQIAAFDNFRKLAEEKRQQQRADVRSVNVRVGHDHNRMVTQLGDIFFVADAHPERCDHRAQLDR